MQGQVVIQLGVALPSKRCGGTHPAANGRGVCRVQDLGTAAGGPRDLFNRGCVDPYPRLRE
eukprot:650713-Pyramimonas_sp.AAC.1